MIRASELAEQLGLPLHGEGDVELGTVSSLQTAQSGAITFLGNNKLRKQLANTRASVVILKKVDLADCPVTAIIAADPYLAYAKAAQILYPQLPGDGVVHSSTVIGQHCDISDSVSIGAQVVIGDRVTLADGVKVDAGCIIGDGCKIAAQTHLKSRVTLLQGINIGERCLIHSGAVIGADGFGFARDKGVWVKIPQVGAVSIGNDVEVGANTTIDRGAVDDTVIEDGVKLDNLIQIGHNVRIGAHTLIAACSSVAGSAKIGKQCLIGGNVGIVGHSTIVDDVIITGRTFVSGSIDKPGSYSSGIPHDKTSAWRRNTVRFKQLDEITKRLKKLENEYDKGN